MTELFLTLFSQFLFNLFIGLHSDIIFEGLLAQPWNLMNGLTDFLGEISLPRVVHFKS